MVTFSSVRSQPIVLSRSVESQVYGLFALAVFLTLVGTFLGIQFAIALLSSGFIFILLIAELAIVFTSRLWMDKSPLNMVLFCAFPLLSGFTLTPFILSVIAGYVNGGSIIINALASTTFMAAAAAVFARTTQWDLGVLGKTLLFAVVGLLFLGILQLFFPSLQGGGFEIFLSGAGVVVFALFTAYDLQRVQALGRAGANPFLLALSLYLDIYNLFLYVLRFMLAISGNRRRSW
jgi:FtsH-binding integral membrane protein